MSALAADLRSVTNGSLASNLLNESAVGLGTPADNGIDLADPRELDLVDSVHRNVRALSLGILFGTSAAIVYALLSVTGSLPENTPPRPETPLPHASTACHSIICPRHEPFRHSLQYDP